MSEDKVYKDGDIVWVKLGNNWWPGEVTGSNRHPEGLIKHLKRIPYCVVKFFNESTYEYVRSAKQIFPFQCAKKEEFLKKGFALYNNGNSFMEKFPEDVEVAERLTRQKESSLIINDRPDSIVKAILGQPLIRTYDGYYDGTEYREKRRSGDYVTKILNITQNHNNENLREKLDKQTISIFPRTQTTASNLPLNQTKNVANATVSNSNNYQCNLCDFTSVRQNVMILHRKMHSNRNSIGSSNGTSASTTITTVNTKSTSAATVKSVPVTKTTTNANKVNQNSQLQQLEIINTDKSISKTKASTIITVPKTAATTTMRKPKTSMKESVKSSPDILSNTAVDVSETAIITTIPREKISKKSKANKSKSPKLVSSKKATPKEKKEQSAYATILSDFCPSDTEISTLAEEKQSRRSLRHKNSSDIARATTTISKVVSNGSTSYIDLSDAKSIQKIPKKRDFSSLQLHKENEVENDVPQMMEPEIYVVDGGKKNTSSPVAQSEDAEDLRKMLLADWSDDDETPLDAIVVEDTVENVESNVCVAESVNEPISSAVIVVTSTPIVKSPIAPTGRIRNIPKKDRRDVVLQDFNSDLSLIQTEKTNNGHKSVALDFDSSNSSVAEVVEDEQPAPIITINDDEEEDSSKLKKNKNYVIVSESKDSDSAVGIDKSASVVTPTTTLSCFDFQEEEDEQDSTATTISHFKKKYLSGDKLEKNTSSNSEDVVEDATKNQAELAEKDQRLTAEIETLLEQTQPPAMDLLNTNSFEESMSVKDLPIKERGKRIFKSRNKSRIEEKIHTTDNIALTAVDANSTSEEQYKSNQNSTVEQIVNNEERNVSEELKLLQQNETTPFKETISTDETNKTDMCITTTEIVDKEKLTQNENKENADLTIAYKNSDDVCNTDLIALEVQQEQTEELTSTDVTYEDVIEKTIPIIENDNVIHNKESFDQKLCDLDKVVVVQLDVNETKTPNEEGKNHLIADSEENIINRMDLPEHNETELELKNKDSENVEEISVSEIVQKQTASEIVKEQSVSEMVQEPVVSEVMQEPAVSEVEEEGMVSEIVETSKIPEEDNIPINVVVSSENELSACLNSENDSPKEIEIPKVAKDTLKNLPHYDMELKLLASTENKEHNAEEEENSDILKIRIKTPDQLLEPPFAIASEQEHIAIDDNLESRIITTTPTDENSSMGASDTCAEFGSPTSMLSEERLPAFRFQNSQTPLQDMETNEAELEESSNQTIHEETINIKKIEPNGVMKENLLNDTNIIENWPNQKRLQQRRFSMEWKSSTSDLKPTKRQRLSVDDTTLGIQNNFLKPLEELKLSSLHQSKNEVMNRLKNCHMQITPRQNVSELFKTCLSHVNQAEGDNPSESVNAHNETQAVKEDTNKKELEKAKEMLIDNNVMENNENSEWKKVSIIQKEETETIKYQNNEMYKETIEATVVSNKLEDTLKDTEKDANLNEVAKNIIIHKEIDSNDEYTNEIPTETETKHHLTTEKKKTEDVNDKVESNEITDKAESMQNVTIMEDNVNVTCSPTKIKDLKITNSEQNQEQQINILRDEENPNLEESKSSVMEENYVQTTIMESPAIISKDENDAENTYMYNDETPIRDVTTTEDEEGNISTHNKILTTDKCKTHSDQGLETPFSPGVPPPTPQEREVVIESENLNQPINSQLYQLKDADSENENLNVYPLTPNENEPINELIMSPLTPKETKSVEESDSERVVLQQIQDTVEIESNVASVGTPQNKNIIEDCDSTIQVPSTPQTKDVIIESEPSTPQGIIECDHNIPAQITPEKEIIIESDTVLATPPSVVEGKDVIIEENIQLEEKSTLLGKEFEIVQPKEFSTGDVQQETPASALHVDADKAAEEFLIEFDSIVNHSHSVDIPNNTVEEAINAEDLINNIIEEVHEDHQLKQEAPKSISPTPLQYEPVTTYTVVAPKNSWNQIFKQSFSRQLSPAKRRQTICFEISDMKEGVACKKQALDFESILPVSKTIKRTAERKLTLPAMETKFSNGSNQQHNIFALNHNQLTLNKKLIPTTKRKLSIEDNITSFIIERPKQQPQQQQQQSTNTTGPPPLQRIRPLSRQSQANTIATNVDNLTAEPQPLQSQDNIFNDLFQTNPSSSSPNVDIAQRPEGGRVIHQQILNSPATSSIPTKRTSDSKVSKNKQIGIDSRGNKYVIIKTPPTDIIVQPSLSSCSSPVVTATNNYGTTITIQPLPRSTTEAATTKTKLLNTKNKNASTSARKQQQQHQQMKQISITVPTKPQLDFGKSSEVVVKAQSRNRRKATQTKVISPTSTTNANINSAKHRQAMEALSRRLSIASEAPPLAKMSRTSTAHVQTQISSSSNLSAFFADTQISNIAQQQLIQLQQQQQQQIQTPISQPPIILNKNAHQQSVIQRKTRKIPQHHYQQQQQQQQQQNQQQYQQQHLQQQQATAKSSQILQQFQQQQQQQQQHHNQLQQQQHQQNQQQFITQITAQPNHQQQPHHNNSLQPPPLQQIQQQTVPIQQQIVQQNDGIIITTTAAEDDNVIDSNTQLIALPTQPYPGYSETFLLCKVNGNTCKPVDNVPLYLNHQLNELVPVPLEALESGRKPQDHQIEIKATNAPQEILAGHNSATQGNEGNLQMANLTCGISDNDISASIDNGANLNQQNQQNHQQQQIMEECIIDDNATNGTNNQMTDFGGNQQDVSADLVPSNGILLNIEGQQVLLDAATFAHLLANPDANTQLISDDGTEYVLTHEVLAALQMQQEQQQALELANVAVVEQQQPHQQQQQQELEQTGSNDIIAVALAGTDLYDNEVLTIDTSQGMQIIDSDGSIVFPPQTGSGTQQHLTPPAVVTNAVLDQSPIMSTLEVPSSIATVHKLQGAQLITAPSQHLAASSNAALGVGGRSNLEDSLAAIGVTTQSSSIPSSLGLPITVTNPNIASKVTSAGPLNEMLQFVSHRPATAAATAAAVAAAALAGESRIFND